MKNYLQYTDVLVWRYMKKQSRTSIKSTQNPVISLLDKFINHKIISSLSPFIININNFSLLHTLLNNRLFICLLDFLLHIPNRFNKLSLMCQKLYKSENTACGHMFLNFLFVIAIVLKTFLTVTHVFLIPIYNKVII